MAWAIFTLWFLDTLTLDINNFLFWSILFISEQDLYIMGILFFSIYLLWFLFGRNFFAVIINEDIAVSRGINVSVYNLVFLLLLSLFIGMSIKIFWVLLIGAFLVIPANIGKILGNSIRSVCIISIIYSLVSVVLWLFSSYFLGTSTGATIVLYLIWGFVVSLVLKNILGKMH
jgi:zinc transport system permease protein